MQQVMCVILVVALACLPAGCGPTREQVRGREGAEAFFRGDFDYAVDRLQPLSQNADGDYVLNNLRLGAAALARGDLDLAERAYFRAYETLNAAGVNNPARTAATLLVNERVRIWLGEPYERAIANFDLGVVYYLQGDYANARGAFENALFSLRRYADRTQDREQQFDEVESTFAVAHLMLGRCWQRLGREDLAERAFASAARLDPSLRDLASPALHAESNVLIVVAYGRGPAKVADGSQVSFSAPARVSLPVPQVSIDGRPAGLTGRGRPTLDTHVMARQRRWQTVDTFRTVRDVTGTVSTVGGVIVLDQGLRRGREETALLGAGLILGGLLLSAASAPDTRQWEMAPRTIYLLPLRLEPGTRDVTVRLPDPGDRSGIGFGDVTKTFRNVPVPPAWDGSGDVPPDVALYARLVSGVRSELDFAAPAVED